MTNAIANQNRTEHDIVSEIALALWQQNTEPSDADDLDEVAAIEKFIFWKQAEALYRQGCRSGSEATPRVVT